MWNNQDAEGEDYGGASDGVFFSLASMNYFCPDIKGYYEGLGDITSDCPLFSVFAMQGLPLVGQGQELKDAGFIMVTQESLE